MALGSSLHKLFVEIGAKTGGLKSGLKGAEKSVLGFSQSTVRNLKLAGAAFVGMSTVAVGAIVKITKSYVDYGVAIDKMVKTTGVAAETMSGLKYAADQEHTSIEVLNKGILNLAKTMDMANRGTNDYSRAFESLGIETKTADGQLRNVEEVFFELSDAIKNSKNQTQAMADAQNLLGRAGKDAIAFFKLGSDRIREYIREAKDLGITLTTVEAKELKAFDDRLVKIGASFRGLGMSVARAVNPILKNLLPVLENQLIPKLKEMADFLSKSVQGWQFFFRIVGGADKEFMSAKNAFDAQQEVVDGLNNKVALATKWIDYLIRNNKYYKEGTQELTAEGKIWKKSLEDSNEQLSIQNKILETSKEAFDAAKKNLLDTARETDNLKNSTDGLNKSLDDEKVNVVNLAEKYGALTNAIKEFKEVSGASIIQKPGEQIQLEEPYQFDEGEGPEGTATQFAMEELDRFRQVNIETVETLQSVWGQFFSTFREGLITSFDTGNTLAQDFGIGLVSISGQFVASLSSGIADLVTAGGKFMDMLKGLAKSLLNTLIQLGIQLTLMAAMKKLFSFKTDAVALTGSAVALGIAGKSLKTSALALAISAEALSSATLNPLGMSVAGTAIGLISGLLGFLKGGIVSKGVGSLPKLDRGGVVEAQKGLSYTGKSGISGIPAILHPNEVVMPMKYVGDMFKSMAEKIFGGFSVPNMAFANAGGGQKVVNLYIQGGMFDDESFWRKIKREKLDPIFEEDVNRVV